MAATDEEIAAYPIDTRISLDLHPQQVLAMPEYTVKTEINVRDTFNAFDAALKAVGKVYDAKEAVEGDPTLNAAAKLLKVDDYASNLLKGVADKMYAAKRYHEEADRILETSFAEPLKQRAAHTISVEIRAFVKAMAATPSGKPGDTVMPSPSCRSRPKNTSTPTGNDWRGALPASAIRNATGCGRWQCLRCKR